VEFIVGWKAHQQITVAGGDRHVLRLTIHEHRRLETSEGAKDTREPRRISMLPFERLHHARD
jgi:hypothetical protein